MQSSVAMFLSHIPLLQQTYIADIFVKTNRYNNAYFLTLLVFEWEMKGNHTRA